VDNSLDISIHAQIWCFQSGGVCAHGMLLHAGWQPRQMLTIRKVIGVV
jgi:hypothetical protein